MRFSESSSEVAARDEVQSLLPRYPWLVAGFSERRHGNLRIGPNGDPVNALARARFAMELEIPPEQVVAPVLVHSSTVRVVGKKDLEKSFEADGLVTAERDLFLSVTTADCLPVFLVDGARRAVGVAHAGWRGLLRGVLEETVRALAGRGASPEHLHAAIGPAIGSCHFEVRLPVARQFEERIGADVVSRRDGKLFVDLKKSAARVLGRAGIAPTNIKTSEVCTYCEERLFSHRRDAKNGVEAMMAVIGIVD